MGDDAASQHNFVFCNGVQGVRAENWATFGAAPTVKIPGCVFLCCFSALMGCLNSLVSKEKTCPKSKPARRQKWRPWFFIHAMKTIKVIPR